MAVDRSKFKHIGTNVLFDDPAHILSPEHISIDNDVHFMHGIYISPCGKHVVVGSNTHCAPYACLYGPLIIGKHCAIAAHVVLASVGHGYDRVDIPMVEQEVQTKEVVLEDEQGPAHFDVEGRFVLPPSQWQEGRSCLWRGVVEAPQGIYDLSL